jgi:hypothetical protein
MPARSRRGRSAVLSRRRLSPSSPRADGRRSREPAVDFVVAVDPAQEDVAGAMRQPLAFDHPPALLHADVAGWPEWQTEIMEARIEGPFETGTSFDWTSYGFSVRSTIYDVDARTRVLWGGTAEGITGIHEWLFTETRGGAPVETNESFEGDPVEADATSMQSMLDASLAAWLGHLKAAAESKT